MNRPSLFTYLIGNILCAPLLVLGSGYVLWQWWNGVLTGVAAMIALVVMVKAITASDTIAAYHDWKRRWNAMEGRAPAPPLLRRIGAVRGMRPLLLVIFWGVAAHLHATYPGDPDIQLGAAVALLALSAAIVGMAVGAAYRSLRRPKRLAPVKLCQRRARRAATRERATRALPDYCKKLLQSP